LDLTEFLRITVNLANALGRLHERGIIHRDIKRQRHCGYGIQQGLAYRLRYRFAAICIPWGLRSTRCSRVSFRLPPFIL
jgi:serine/threonine protein kinase